MGEQQNNQSEGLWFIAWVAFAISGLVCWAATSFIVGGIFTFIIAAIICFIATLYIYNKLNVNIADNKFNALLLCFFFCFTGWQSCTNNVKDVGWEYIQSHLQSPSTASLVSYVGPNNSTLEGFAKKIGVKNLSIAMYEVDAQNGFGAMIRTKYYVFFKSGTPVYIADGSELYDSEDTFRMIRFMVDDK